MKDFADALIDAILVEEVPKINQIMADMAKNVQNDLYNTTLILLDTYYNGYQRPPRKYTRIDERRLPSRWKNRKGEKKSFKNKKGRFATPRSLRQAIWNGKDSISFADVDPQQSISFAVGNIDGYYAGIQFSEDYFESNMFHPNAGIDEFNIVENFLFSNTDGIGQHPNMMRTPEAAEFLYRYLDNYDNTIDKFYQDACKKYR